MWPGYGQCPAHQALISSFPSINFNQQKQGEPVVSVSGYTPFLRLSSVKPSLEDYKKSIVQLVLVYEYWLLETVSYVVSMWPVH